MAVRSPLVGVVLAGGKGRRFGGLNKALVPLGGQPLAAVTTQRLSAQVDIAAINANRDLEAITALGWPIVADGLGGDLGPLDAVLGAMAYAAAQGASHVVTVPVDTPFFPSDLVAQLKGSAGIAPVMAVHEGRTHGAHTLWPVALQSRLTSFISAGSTLKLNAFLEQCSAVSVAFDDAPAHAFLNINTPEDLAHAERLLQGG